MTLDTSITLHRRGSGRCLVLLHCLGVDRHFWDFVAPLSRELTLVSYDLPGHGETPVPNGPYSIEDLAAQLAGLLKRDGIARAHIVGISLGGLIAQAFAATHPQTVDRLAAVNVDPMPMTLAEFDSFFKKDVAANLALVKAANIPRQ